jgi:CheY-like chemotaxis protein
MPWRAFGFDHPAELIGKSDFDFFTAEHAEPAFEGPRWISYEATRQIRQIETQESRSAIVAMTVEAMTGARETCLAAGMDDYISKAIKMEDLSSALEAWAAARAVSA